MQTVPIARFKDRVSEYITAAETGQEIVITRHGRPTVRLMAVADDRLVRQRAAVQKLLETGRRIRAKHGSVPVEQIVDWIREDRD